MSFARTCVVYVMGAVVVATAHGLLSGTVTADDEEQPLPSTASQLEAEAASIKYGIASDITLVQEKRTIEAESEAHKKFLETREAEEKRKHNEEQGRIHIAMDSNMRIEEATAVADALEQRLADEKAAVARARWSEQQAQEHQADFERQASENRAKASAARIRKAEARAILESQSKIVKSVSSTLNGKKEKMADMASKYFVSQQKSASNMKLALSAQRTKDEMDNTMAELKQKRYKAAERLRRAMKGKTAANELFENITLEADTQRSRAVSADMVAVRAQSEKATLLKEGEVAKVKLEQAKASVLEKEEEWREAKPILVMAEAKERTRRIEKQRIQVQKAQDKMKIKKEEEQEASEAASKKLSEVMGWAAFLKYLSEGMNAMCKDTAFMHKKACREQGFAQKLSAVTSPGAGSEVHG